MQVISLIPFYHSLYFCALWFGTIFLMILFDLAAIEGFHSTATGQTSNLLEEEES